MSSLVSNLLILAETFCTRRSLSRGRVSTLVFNDGKRLTRLAEGKGLQISTYERAIDWFSANWPEGAEWPADVPRPDTPTLAPEPAPHHETDEECVA